MFGYQYHEIYLHYRIGILLRNMSSVSRVIGLSGEGRLINGMKKKFASANSKLHRICGETGNVTKLEKLLTSNKDIDLSKIKFVSEITVFRSRLL